MVQDARRPAPLQVRVPADLESAFADLAKRRNVTTSALLRELMRQAVDGAADAVPAPPTPASQPCEQADLQRERITLRLPAYVMRLAAHRAGQARSPLATWLANLVQSNVTGSPVLEETTRRELEAATRELAAVGRNINQIARALNEAHFRTERVKLERLDELDKTISRLRLAVRSSVDASMNAWRG